MIIGSRNSYAGARGSNRRKTPPRFVVHEEQALRDQQRRALIENTHDLDRNFSLASWSVRQHLDYVSTFGFQAKNDSDALNQRIEELVKWWSGPLNFDVARRHSLSSFIRLAESSRTIGGDILLVKMGDGKLQAIEADRIRDRPPKNTAKNWANGVEYSPGGAARSYAVWNRGPNGEYGYNRSVRAGNAFHLGYFQRFDQLRGISPLASALDSYRDLAENFEYALAKAKICQMFGLAHFGEPDDRCDDNGEPLPLPENNIDLSTGAPFFTEYNQDDKLEVVESKQPSSEFQAFTVQMAGIALKSLDIPMSFMDESHTNFFGSMAAQGRYIKAASAKQIGLREQLLDPMIAWRLRMWVLSGVLELPPGMSVADLRWEWIPQNAPWWRPLEGVRADLEQIRGGLNSLREIVKQRTGRDYAEVIAELGEDYRLAEAAGVPLPALHEAVWRYSPENQEQPE